MSNQQSSTWREEAMRLTTDVEVLRTDRQPFIWQRMRCQEQLQAAIDSLRDAADAWDEYVVESEMQVPANIIREFLERVFASNANALGANGMLADIKASALDILRELRAHGYEVTLS